jgi:hypothetical protein
MLARAAVTVSARADFVVERAIDLVLLGTEDGCKVVGHGYWKALMLAEEDLRESEIKASCRRCRRSRQK